MKLLKFLIKTLIVLLISIVIAIGVILGIDSSNTSYLKISKQRSLQINSYLIQNVNVIPMDHDTVLKNHMVQVEVGIISKIEKNIDAPTLTVIKGNNQYLSPGLIDMHVHVWDKQELGLYLANGVTGIRNLWGIPFHLRIKKAISNQEIIWPVFFTSSPKLTGKNDLGDDKVQISSPEEAKKMVIEYKERGYDFIKTYAGLTEAEYIAIVEQAEKSNIKVVAHPSYKVAYREQFHPQIATLEHTEDIVQQPLIYELDSVKLVDIVQEMAIRNQAFSPTLTGFYKIYEMLTDDAIINSKQTKYINPLFFDVDSKNQIARWQNEKQSKPEVVDRIKKQHEFHLYAVNQMYKAGVTLVCSTDAGIALTAPGYSIHEELQFYKEAGMPNYEVLKTATINPGRVHDEFSTMGSIAVGKLANFVFTDANPLEKISTLASPNSVMINGRMLSKELLQEFDKNAKNRKNKLVSALRWIEYLWIEK